MPEETKTQTNIAIEAPKQKTKGKPVFPLKKIKSSNNFSRKRGFLPCLSTYKQ